MDESEKQHILIVDDRPKNLAALEILLRRPNLTIIKAESGQDALWRVLEYNFAVILLDVQMPDMDGFETAKLIHSNVQTRHIPIIFVTAINKEEKYIFEGYESGAVDYLFKPLDSKIVKSKVNVFLELSKKTELIEKQKALLEESEKKFRSITTSAAIGIALLSIEGKIIECNPALEKILGYSKEEILAFSSFADFTHPDDITQDSQLLEELLAEKRSFYKLEKRFFRKEGIVVWGNFTASVIRNDKGVPLYRIGLIEDITIHKLLEEELRELAYFDPLTAIPNRKLFLDRLNQTLQIAERKKQSFALLFMDLDGFKAINDSLGHKAGDLLLKEVARRLTDIVRKSDTVARIGGDEFVVILNDITTDQDAGVLAQKAIDSLHLPFVLAGKECGVGVSIGIGIYPTDGEDIDNLISNADSAMYHAKGNKKNCYRFYDPQLNSANNERLKVIEDLRRALSEQEFILVYQPQIDLNTNRIIGVEALIRWQHKDRGVLLPEDFLFLVEETGLITQLDKWVLQAACAQLKAWQNTALAQLKIAVNLSDVRFEEQKYETVIIELLNQNRLSPDLLELELTENIFKQDSEKNMNTFLQLKEQNIKIAVDDYGTGFSSLKSLNSFPIYKLKIDRSFVQKIATDPDSAVIVRAVINMAHNLDLKAIAEGVETKEQLELLHSFNCDEAQGFLFSKPVSVDKLLRLMTDV